VFVPRDTWNSKTPIARESGDGYFGITLAPSLSGSGDVLIVSGTGGSAVNAAMDFLSSEESISEVRHKLGGGKNEFPAFEALVRVSGRSKLPKNASIVLLRATPTR
jgi:hypothetical protein